MGKLKSNFIYDTVYQILLLIIPLITTPYVARTVGANGVGVYSYTYSIVSYFMLFALLGMNNYGNREVSKNRDNQEKLNYVFTSIYVLQLIITIIVTIVYIGYVLIAHTSYMNFELIQILYLISVAFDINWLFCGLQKFKMTITRSAIIKVATLILILCFVKSEGDLWKYILILAATTLLNQMVLWPFRKKEVKFVKVKAKDVLRHLKPTLMLFIPIISMSIYNLMSKIMLGQMTSMEDVGYYENANKMLNIVLTIVSALVTVTLPQMTYLYNNGKKEEFNRILSKSIEFIYFMAFPVIFGFLATGDMLVKIYLGDGFLQCSTILKVLSFMLMFMPIANVIRMQYLIPRNKDKEYIISIVTGAIVNLLLNLFTIGKYGAIGAAISAVITQFVIAFLQFFLIRKEFSVKQYILPILSFLWKSFVMYIIVIGLGMLIKDELIKFIVQVLVGVLVYCLLNIKYITEQIGIRDILRKLKKKIN